MKLRLPSRRRALKWLGIGLVVVIVALYVLLPIGVGIAVVLPMKDSVGDPPQGFEEVTLTTGDDVTLAGWYAPPPADPAEGGAPVSGAVIILIHGAGGSRESMRKQAAMLLEHGYGVLAIDLRGHGESDGRTNRLGWQGTRDVGAAVSFLSGRDEVTAIGALGSSLGGEVALGAASTYPQITAIAADGATRRTLDEQLALSSERPLVRNYVSRVMFATVRVLSGEKPPKPLLDSMIEAESTRFFLIAGGANNQEVKYNELFVEKVGERATLWVAPGAKHTGAYGRFPEEYEQRVLAFFDSAFAE